MKKLKNLIILKIYIHAILIIKIQILMIEIDEMINFK